MSYITRSLEKVVQQVTQEYSVVLVTGPRQVGKTTMLQKLMEGTSRGYVSLDDLNERALAKNDPELFLQLHKPPVLIDEVQYAPELFTYIKVYADTHHEPGAFWLTGSQVFKLMHGVQESLAGRAVNDFSFAVRNKRCRYRAFPCGFGRSAEPRGKSCARRYQRYL